MFEINQLLPQDICLKCDGCCRFAQEESTWQPALLDAEIKIICKDNLLKQSISPSKKIKSIPYKEGFICSCFDVGNNRCKIYNIRPLECRLYPFLINRSKEKTYLAVDLNCPYIKDKLEDKDFKDYVNYLINFFNLRSVSSAIKQNPRTFKDYKEDKVKNLSELVF